MTLPPKASGDILYATLWNIVQALAESAMRPTDNLAGLADNATARTNLGLSTAAATGDYDDLANRPITHDAAAPSLDIVDEYGFVIVRIDENGSLLLPEIVGLTATDAVIADLTATDAVVSVSADLPGVIATIGATGASFDVADDYGFVALRVADDGAVEVPGGAFSTGDIDGCAFAMVDDYGFVGAAILTDGTGIGAFGGTGTTTPSGVSVDPAVVIRRGAEGDVWGATYPAPYYLYNSTQGEKTQQYICRGDIDTAGQGQMLANSPDLEIWISYGQSWRTDSPTLAGLAVDAATIADRNACFRFSAGANDFRGLVGTVDDVTGIVDIVGIGLDNRGDQIGSAALLALQRHRRAAGVQVVPGLTYCAGYPGAPWGQLKPGGSQPYWTYLQEMNVLAADFAEQYGRRPVFRAVGWTHAAASDASGTNYGDQLDEMLAAFDALNLNAGVTDLHYFTDQTPSVTNMTGDAKVNVGRQLQFAIDNADRVHLIGPRYPYPFRDYIHHTGPAAVAIGELEGYVKHRVLDEGITWTPLRMSAWYIVGTTLTIDVTQPVAGEIRALEIDTTTIEADAQYGLRLKVNGSFVALSAISVDRHRITATIASAPASSDTIELSNAVYGPGTAIGTHAGAWGNFKMVLADSLMLPGTTIDAWLAIQYVTVAAGDFASPPAMPAITAIAITASTATSGSTSESRIGVVSSTTSGTVGTVTYEVTDDAGGKYFFGPGRPQVTNDPEHLYGIANLPPGSHVVEITARADGATDFVDTITITVT